MESNAQMCMESGMLGCGLLCKQGSADQDVVSCSTRFRQHSQHIYHGVKCAP